MTARHRARDLRRSNIPHVEMRGDRPVAVVGRYEFTVQGTSVSTSVTPAASIEEQNRALAAAHMVWYSAVLRPPFYPIDQPVTTCAQEVGAALWPPEPNGPTRADRVVKEPW